MTIASDIDSIEMAQWLVETYQGTYPRTRAEAGLKMIKWMEENITWDDDVEPNRDNSSNREAHRSWVNDTFRMAAKEG